MEHKPEVPQVKEVEDFRGKGNISFKNKKFLDAIKYYQQGLELDPNNPCLNNNIAQAYLEIHDFENAKCHAIKGLQFQDSVKGYYRAAKACVGVGDIIRAIKYLTDGIEKCADYNTQDLRNFLQTLRDHQFQGTEAVFERPQEDLIGTVNDDVPSLTSDSESDEYKHDKLRSQSVSRVSTSTTILARNKTSTRSLSVSRTSSNDADIKADKNAKKKNRNRDRIEKNPFIATLASIKKELGMPDITPEMFWIMLRNELQSLLKEGSELMGRGLSRRAVEKYKNALDVILDHSLASFRMREIDLVVLKYALCVGWIDHADYGEIVKAVEHLKGIEDTCASKFPAVFYGLGHAYYKLNRYKIATEHLKKGLLFLDRGVKFEVHSWPGTNEIIPETRRSDLREVLNKLLNTCCAYHGPDAVCRYSKCLSISSHIIPSELIFYSDPDFSGFVVVYCQEKCKIEYHLGCWKDYKEAVMSSEIGKLSDKDFIGRSCPTTDCVTQTKEQSVITKIEIVGDDTTVKASIEAPKSDTTIKESKKTKKKKSDRNAEATVQDKPKNKLHLKIKKNISETIQTASQEMQASSSAEELELRLEKLKLLRDVNFGYTNDNHWNPKEDYYGREDIRCLDHYLSPESIEETKEMKGRKEFIFSYFYEFIRNEGPQKIQELEDKWQNELGDFEGISDFINSHTNICTFLRQSYRFASVDGYMCLSEQLAETYKKAKTQLVQRLSTMMEDADYKKLLPGVSEHPVLNNPHTDPERMLPVTDNLTAHNYGSKPSVVTTILSYGDKFPGSTNGGEVFIPHAEVHDLVEDPDIHTAEDVLAAKRLPTARLESVSGSEALVESYSNSDDSDELDSRSDDIHHDDEEEEDDCGGGEQLKNDMTHRENMIKNNEEESSNEKLETKNIQVEDELAKGLNPDANEFKPIDIVGPQHRKSVSDSEGNVPVKTAVGIVPASVDSIHLIGTASEHNALGLPSTLQSVMSSLEKWSPANDQPEVPAVHLTALPLQKTALPPAMSHAHPTLPSQQLSDLSVSSTHIIEMPNFEEEAVTVKNKVKERLQQLEASNKEKKALESKLEQQDKKIKELELEVVKIAEKKNKVIAILKEKLMKKEEECEAERMKLNKEKREKEISERNTQERMRNLISETGQKVKQLEEELSVKTHDVVQFQKLVFESRMEARELQISTLKQKCLNTMNAMQCKMKDFMDSGIPNNTEITAAIQSWEQYLMSITEHEVQFRVYCSSLSSRLGSLTVEDFTLKWPYLPEEPTCSLDLLEEMTQKALNEREDMKEKLVTQDKTVTEGKEEQRRALKVVEEPYKLKKTIDSRQEKITNPVLSKEQPLDPSKTLENLNEIAKKVDPSNLKEEEKGEQKPEHLVGSDQQDLKQNIHSNVYTTLSSAKAESPMLPLAGVPYYQNSAQHFTHQPMMHNFPYFYNVPQMNYTPLPVPMLYGQQQNPPVTSFGSPFQHSVPSASRGNVKISTQQQAEGKPAPSSIATEVSRIAVSSTDMAGKSQPLLESRTVPKKKKSPSPVSGLTPIELTNNESTQNVRAVAASQRIADPVVTKALPVSASAVGVPKQNLQHMSKPAETQKPSLLTPSMIPAATVLESVPDITSAPKHKKGGSFQKLLDQLRKNFPTRTEEELFSSVAAVRERNNNSLTGLTVPNIISMVDRFLKEKASKKQGSMGLDKFGGTAWGGVRDTALSWSKSSDNSEDECVICMEPMDEDQTALQCKHMFHTKCIRQWLRTESVCPICRVFTRMVDEFPPLS